jgi:hypothetical protein
MTILIRMKYIFTYDYYNPETCADQRSSRGAWKICFSTAAAGFGFPSKSICDVLAAQGSRHVFFPIQKSRPPSAENAISWLCA